MLLDEATDLPIQVPVLGCSSPEEAVRRGLQDVRLGVYSCCSQCAVHADGVYGQLVPNSSV
jgi:hypothetical protein